MFKAEVVRKIKLIFFLCSVTFFFENHAVYEVMWESIVEPDGPQMTYALHAGHLRLQTHTRSV